ncbi:MAG: T9SS type A sorting domain-containing protein [Bacteroidota bacterium]
MKTPLIPAIHKLSMPIVIALLVTPASASDKKNGPYGAESLTAWPLTSTILNINQVSCWARNDGWNARDPANGNVGLMFPRGKVGTVFQDGILWGGKVFDGGTLNPRVGGQTYQVGTLPGRIIAPGIQPDTSDSTVRIYRIRADFRTADLRLDAAELNRVSLGQVTPAMVRAVRTQYEKDWNEWPWQQGAPFYDSNNNSVRDTGESPGLANADQVIWYVANDLNEALVGALYDSPPIGLEMQVTMWGYRTDIPPWSSTILKRVKLIYKGTALTPANAHIDSMFIAQWSDTDLGDAGDDFAGCDTSLALNYVYNGESSDKDYAMFQIPPPAVGYQFVQTPTVSGDHSDSAIVDLQYVRGKRNVDMYSMIFLAPGGEEPPWRYPSYYFLMRGLHFYSAVPFVHPSLPNDTTRFWLDGDPVAGTGRLDGIISVVGDRRIMGSAGPFTMALGDTQEIVIATMVAPGSSNIESVRQLRYFAMHVRDDFHSLLDGHVLNPDNHLTLAPTRFFLHPTYPNPFNPATVIRYEIGYQLRVRIRVFDILGREVATLVDEVKGPGDYEVSWDGAGFASGVYIFSIEAGPYFRSMKGLLLK